MDLVKSVETESLEKVKDLINRKGLPKSKWLDYKALNASLVKGRTDVAKVLLENNCRVNKPKNDALVDTPLHHAVLLEDIELVEILLVKKASITDKNTKNDTPLQLAFMSRFDNVVDLMLTYIKNTKNYMNPSNKRGLTHMHIACIRNNADVVKGFLSSGVHVQIAINNDSSLWAGYTPLHFAVENKCYDVMKVLIDHKAKFHEKNAAGCRPSEIAREYFIDFSVMNYILQNHNLKDDLTSFHVACAQIDPRLILKFLENEVAINNSVNLYGTNKFCPGYTPLHFAVASNFEPNVRLLLENGAKIQMRDEHYMTPLHLALYNDNYRVLRYTNNDSIVELLWSALESKCIPCTDFNNLTYFHIACSRNDVSVVKQFLSNGQDVNDRVLPNTKQFTHFTPLHFAVAYNSIEVVKLLVNCGAKVNVNDFHFEGTPLHIALESGNIELVDYLIENGAVLNVIRLHKKKTPLHLFVEGVMNNGMPPFDNVNNFLKKLDKQERYVVKYIKLLIESGCDINAQDEDGDTALHIASSKLKYGMECVCELIAHGADINIENNEGETPFDMTFNDIYRMNAGDYMYFFNHVQKLKDLGFYINPKNEECCQKLLNEKDECDPDSPCLSQKYIVTVREKRSEEIKKMKSTMINKRTSLYDFALADLKKLKIYTKSDSLKKIIQAEDFKKQFPSYSFLLKLQYNKGLKNIESTLTAVSSSATKCTTRSKRRNPDVTKKSTEKQEKNCAKRQRISRSVTKN